MPAPRDDARRGSGAAGSPRSARPLFGATALGVTGDVTSFGELEALRRQVEEGLGPIDVLVANAGGNFTRARFDRHDRFVGGPPS
ncbi:SDR family NAD(P)-dependent oxidoreductase [Sinomonas sp. JGH33]|uniref:SDR family NAD(P)-dependent oxidoreductase n=1 Tax=Sinomonas terricola TaxID=3110330 RepID=A0ABU5TBI5_9MICC|nr:SDR family NAD(P)-dependent oxidoreductase [Sinomonas sp. JGH33]MEA5457051.1 SDR family NAD(P)-dependent oxidoreductase [Sinomonas sp. JGH33]